ncbi:NAD-dependent epimerase/dehydratase family protein [Streptomyces clavuligerus]|uniref:NAD-dependent epimerase/dehydratase family protein n=1 Tax=Streptomyces clavuligerus TaxID=1901 RepID=UPI0008106151|nr:NAD-dependent epimerase/dehydratase family protein [Streptomyces clavuligerus]ANW17094.1 epimerase [Streptomyces clavuligerus]AXU11633.1 NAD-dependent epimerase/dehydratase family protein [Streptomyces clavuligerus]MBY6301467.1 NAD-dependent epimerase/dehydratase family protein [Streptomyces clavuligerus]QPL61753.1 NAD-dependent epimerase/dehydratase family protein [Streptomyces clavuligerus]QPL67786.1 NAD-dependent epimerase/dehydratase family protein [Streptomyces clavuligerus]
MTVTTDDDVLGTGDSVAARLEKLRGSRIVVTGGAGLVGSRLTALLRRAGAEVTVVDRMDAYPDGTHELFGAARTATRLLVGDIRNRELVRTALGGADHVVHAAAFADVAACTRRPDIAFRANVEGTETVLEEAVAAEVRRLVLISSAAVYGNGPAAAAGPHRFHEDQTTHPLSVYANSKLWAEHQTRLLLGGTGTEYAVLRYFSVYGDPQIPKPGSHSWMVAWLAMHARLGLPMRLNGGGVQVRDLVHVDDIAAATALALVEEGVVGETVNVGTGIPTSVREVGELIAPHFPGSRFITTPRPADDPLGGYAATERLHELLRWRPAVSVAEGVERYVRWLSATPEAVPGWLAERAA